MVPPEEVVSRMEHNDELGDSSRCPDICADVPDNIALELDVVMGPPTKNVVTTVQLRHTIGVYFRPRRTPRRPSMGRFRTLTGPPSDAGSPFPKSSDPSWIPTGPRGRLRHN